MDNDELMLEWSEAGIITNVTFDDTGEIESYDIDWDRFREYDPIVADYFWQAHLQEVGEALQNLTDQGLLDMYFVEREDGTIEEAYRVSDIERIQDNG